MRIVKDFLSKFLSRQIINNFYHLPKAILANILYGFPTKKLKVIGVTGTDGKTTTVNMIYQILKAAGKKVSMISTINAPGFHVTSPDPFTIQKFAKDAVNKKCEYLVLEVTSHALDQYRFWGINFEIGVITNITHEHLDYHKNFENYFNTKFKLIKNVKSAIINQSIQETGEKAITFGLDKGDFNQKEVKLNLKIPGDYNIENGLAVLAVAFVLGIDKKLAQKTLENFSGVTGRMEEVKNSRGIKIFIDFAHTPNGLEQALKILKRETKGRLIAVFGSAGRRDIGKRSLMGEAAGRFADLVVITAEDSRGELKIINQQIIAGLEKAGLKKGINYFVEEDREKAIGLAINKLAKRDDTVGIFGKGHEESMNLDGKTEIPWSDFKAVEKALS